MPLPALVAPGQTADISVDLVAPSAQGEYGGFWQLQTPGGTTFGMGPGGSGNLWVQIRVAGEPIATRTASSTAVASPAVTPTDWAEATLTAFVATQTAAAAPSATPSVIASPVEVSGLATTACDAQWQANDGILGCPGTDGDPRGLIAILSQANLEDGTTASAPTLLTVPSDAEDGYILGLYPQYQVQPGDRFQAGVGCEIGAQLCSVLFRVSYLDTTGAAHDLWTVGEFLDGHHVELDLDLSALAGQQIRIVLEREQPGQLRRRPRPVGCASHCEPAGGWPAGGSHGSADQHATRNCHCTQHLRRRKARRPAQRPFRQQPRRHRSHPFPNSSTPWWSSSGSCSAR